MFFRSELPFVFEVPTTLEALHDMIATYASTGKDASTIIHRIHACNSVRLNRKNTEKMQNFYDVVLRRFIAVGDAIHRSGDGGPELGRFDQLNELTKLLYTMAQESPESAGAVWARRLGILHNAHAKRLRDAELQTEEEHETAWPSIGVVLILRALGHVFPVTDKRHYVVTPAMLLLGQMIAHTPVLLTYDLVMGVLCSGLLIEYSREAKRFAPESISFISGVIRLFAVEGSERSSEKVIPTVSDTANRDFAKQLREKAANADDNTALRISFEEREISGDSTPAAILFAVLSLSESAATSLSGAMDSAEREALHELTESLLCLKPTHKKFPLGKVLRDKVASAAKAVADACQYDSTRSPLTRRSGAKLSVIKTLAPKMEDPEKYKESRDKGKSATQADLDRTRRELKRERKAVSRELRLDAAFVEAERREERDRKDSAARAQRNKAFSWLEMEQASMNQQVREGGGLLSGGGMGAARAKAKSGKVGIKKGGKF
jgi:nucleolar protein 14